MAFKMNPLTKKRFSDMYDQRIEENNIKYYDIMVLQENDHWALSQVVGKSMSGFLLFSGWFISGCFKVQDYMTIAEFNEIQPSNDPWFTYPLIHSDISNIRV